MSKLLLIGSLLAIASVSIPAYAGCGKVLQEAETKKDTLPVKYKKLVKENDEMRSELESCRQKKEELQSSIADLNMKILSLETERSRLQSELSKMPSREELEAKLRTLEEE